MQVSTMADGVSWRDLSEALKGSHVRVSTEQRKMMLEFMEEHPALAHNKFCGPQGAAIRQRLWAEMASSLNAYPGGAHKSTEKWIKSWQDWKSDTKVKGQKIMKNAGSPRAGTLLHPLTVTEERLLQLLRRRDIVETKTKSDPQVSKAPIAAEVSSPSPSLSIPQAIVLILPEDCSGASSSLPTPSPNPSTSTPLPPLSTIPSTSTPHPPPIPSTSPSLPPPLTPIPCTSTPLPPPPSPIPSTSTPLPPPSIPSTSPSLPPPLTPIPSTSTPLPPPPIPSTSPSLPPPLTPISCTSTPLPPPPPSPIPSTSTPLPPSSIPSTSPSLPPPPSPIPSSSTPLPLPSPIPTTFSSLLPLSSTSITQGTSHSKLKEGPRQRGRKRKRRENVDVRISSIEKRLAAAVEVRAEAEKSRATEEATKSAATMQMVATFREIGGVVKKVADEFIKFLDQYKK